MQIANYQIVKLSTDDIVPEIPENEPVNHIWIYDRSGSMYDTLTGLCENIVAQAKLLKVGDSLTICWFSGEGQYGCILKGFKISSYDDYQYIEKALSANNTTIGTTCFSESFINLKTIITDIKTIFSSKIVLCLFTDGYPVVDNYQKELSNLFQAISLIKDDLAAVLLIGYGEAYNKDLMTNMAQRLDGALIHNSSLSDTSRTLTDFIKDSIILPHSTVGYPYYQLGQQNILLACSAHHNHLYLHNIEQAKLTGQFHIVGSDLYLLLEGNEEIDEQEIGDNVIYGLAAGLVQQTKTDIALLLLNHIGDKYLMDLIINAFTNSEYGKAEEAIRLAMADPSHRYKDGKVNNYLPNENAFCLLDLLYLLMEDKDAKFYPKHPAFNYKKIGKSFKVKEGYEKFIADKDVAVPISNMTWHKEKLNLSILCKIPGTVTFRDNKLIADAYPTFQYRNYTIIKNALLNVEQLPFTCSEGAMNKLLQHGVKVELGDINILYLNSLPFINKALIKDRCSAKILANKAMEALKLEAKMKVFNDKNPKVKVIEGLAIELSSDLIGKGFRSDGSYNPPTETIKNSELTDYYMAKTFKIKIKGGSTIPKVETVENKIQNKKKLNFVEEFMKEALEECKQHEVAEIQKLTKKELSDIRRYIQETKFALILSKRWFPEFSSFENCTIDNVTFVLDEEKVMID